MQSTVLRTLFQQLDPNEYITVRAIVSGQKDVVADYVRSVDAAEKFVDKHRLTRDVYFGVCTRKAKRPEEEYVNRAFAVWADVDGSGSDKHGEITEPKEDKLKEALEALILPPSLIVDSGHGYHLYWQTAQPTTELIRIKAINLKIQGVLGSGAVSDPTRILRVDGTFNHKSGSPEAVTLHSQTPHTYELQDLYAMCRLARDPKLMAKVRKGDSRGHKSKSERDWAILVSLVKLGFSDAGIRFLFEHNECGDKYRAKPPEGGEKYFERSLKEVRAQTKVSEEAGEAAAETDDSVVSIIEKDDCYWTITDSGLKQLSTFIFIPEVLLHGETTQDPDVLMGRIRAVGFEWPNIALTRKAFVKADSLIKELPLAAWQWLGSDSTVKHLLPYLMDKLRAKGLPKRTATQELGYYKGGYWIGTTQTISPNGEILTESADVVALPTKGERPKVSYSLEGPSKEEVQEFFNLVQKINTPSVVWPILAWTAACPFKTRLQEITARFPVLNLYGTRGSGKTSIITRVIQPLMGYDEPRTYDCSTTKFVQLSLLGSSNGVPVAFSEYRSSMKQVADRMLRYLLLSYDVGHDPRGRPDQTVQDYSLAAPFSVDGNDALSDEAVLERVIQINMHPEAIDETTEAFDAFQDLTMMNLKRVGTAFIISTLNKEPRWEEALKLAKVAFPEKMPDRVRRNLAVCIVGLLHLKQFATQYACELPKIDAEFIRASFAECLSNVVNTTTGRGNLVVDQFVEDIVNECAMHNGTPTHFIAKYDDTENVLWFQLSTAMTWWYVKRRMQDRVTMDSAAVKAQLRERMAQTLTELDSGQYIVGREAKTIDGRTHWVYGVSLKSASTAGLDTPQSLSILRVRAVSKDKETSNDSSSETKSSSNR